MPEDQEATVAERQERKTKDRRVHMANERTFLAWIRTSIGIMAFGFVVEKFNLFLKQFSYLMGKASLPPSSAYSSLPGIFLIALGAIMGFLAFIRYKRVEKQIEEDTYRPLALLDIMLTLSVVAIGVFLMIYLLHSL